MRRGRSARRALLPPMLQNPSARPPGRLLSFPRAAEKAAGRADGDRATVSRAEPAIPPRLLLQRERAGAPREPRAIVVPERRLPDAEAADRPRGVSAAARGAGGGRSAGGVEAGAAGAPPGSVRTQRGARRDSRSAVWRRTGGGTEGAARTRAEADRRETRRSRGAVERPLGPMGRPRRGCAGRRAPGGPHVA